MNNEYQSFLGIGWTFPPSFDNSNGSVVMAIEEENVSQSLLALLSTQKGERIMRPDFGCNLTDLLFEPLTTTLKTEVRDLIRAAVTYYEPRVELLRVDINEDDNNYGVLLIEMDYLIRASNSRYNLVLPFYTTESDAPPGFTF